MGVCSGGLLVFLVLANIAWSLSKKVLVHAPHVAMALVLTPSVKTCVQLEQPWGFLEARDGRAPRARARNCSQRSTSLVCQDCSAMTIRESTSMTKPVAHKRSAAAMEKLRARLIAVGGDAMLLDGWSARQGRQLLHSLCCSGVYHRKGHAMSFFSPCGQRFKTVMAAVNFLGFEHEQRRLRGRRPLLLEECPVSASAMDALRAHLSGVAATADDVLLEGWTAHKVSRSPNAKKNENGSTKQEIVYKSPSGMKFWGRAAVERFLLQAEERHWPRAKQPRLAVPAGAMGRETVEASGHNPHEVLPSGLPVAASGIEIVPSDAVCEACGDGDDEAGNEILLCDGEGCEAAFHLQCLPVVLAQVPLGDWLCPACAGPPPLSGDASVQAAATTVVESVSVEVASIASGEGYLDVDVINVSCVAV